MGRRPPARKAGKGMTVVVTGIDGVDRKLRALPQALEKKVVRQAVRKSLGLVRDAVKANAPVASGLTKKSAKIRAPKKRKPGRIAMQVRIGEGDYQGKTFYAAFNEFGHDVVRDDRVVGHFEGSHFMERAFEEKAGSAKEACVEEISRGVDAVVIELGRSG